MAKETRLNEEAAIYQKRAPETEKEKWSEMNNKQRIAYFKDYYLKKVIVGVIVISFSVYLLITVLSPKPDSILYTMIINDYIDSDTKNAWETDLKDYYQLNPDTQELSIDDTCYILENDMSQSSIAAEQKIATYIYAGQIDVIITDEALFERYASIGYFMDLADCLPTNLYEYFMDSFYMAKQEDDIKEEAYGIRLDDCEFYQNLGTSLKHPVIGVIASSKNVENSVDFIKYLYEIQ